MKRITTWLALTLSVVGLATWYQVTGSTGHGKEGEPPAAAAQSASDCSGNGAPRTATAPEAGAAAPSSAAESASNGDPAPAAAAPSSGEKANDPCADSDHTGKPGERK